MRGCCDHLVVLRLLRDGSAEEGHNGPGTPAWNAAGAMQKNGQRPIALSKVHGQMVGIAQAGRLPLAPNER